ncbi:hypothetical protein QJ48_09345 [Paenibacillus sp. A3]|uniref:hypothetical protein n=1 Tax=Paenibacillus sp. A3 TaxID=1337054 RepID=UPI0006D55C70|nr:hypothetical protein [Paenibacillus sp. A3]KPV59781.1 hypothetical protein QJ48_09345 [Paenibacillus sp. A3]
MLTILISFAAVVCVISTAASFMLARRQQNKEFDKNADPTAVKHPVMANPMLIVYVLFPIVLAAGAVIWSFYFK